MGALASIYLNSERFTAMAPRSQNLRRQTIEKLVVGDRERVKAAAVAERHIRADIAPLSKGAAHHRLCAWRALMAMAVDVGWIEASPAERARRIKPKVVPLHSWTAHERAQFRDAYPYHTRERVAFELLFWSGARRSDGCRLRWDDVDNEGWLSFTQQKTGGPVQIPLTMLPAACEELGGDFDHLQRALRHAGSTYFIETPANAQRSHAGFGPWWNRAIATAALPGRCTAHGLRKARATVLREIGWPDNRIGAWTGHQSLREVAHYGAAADRRRMIAGA